jgi:hypothetical protein
MMLMAMDDISVADFAKGFEAEWIGTMPTHEPWASDRSDAQRADLLGARLLTKGDQRRGDSAGPLARQLVGLSLCPTHDPVGSEPGRPIGGNVHGAGTPAGWG